MIYKTMYNTNNVRKIQGTICFSLVLLVLSMLYFSCTSSLDEGELRVVLSGNPDTLDPHRTSATITSQVNNSIYESLFYSDGSGVLVDSVEVQDKGKTWILQLKQGILFHHDKELQSDDVAASLMRLKESEGDSPSPFAEQYSIITSIEIVDNYTVKIILEYAHNGFKAMLGSPESMILPADLIRSEHNFNIAPIGTGVYKFETWQQNKAIQLSKNHDHPKPAHIETIVFVIIKDRNAQLQALYAEEVDIVPYLGEVEAQQVVSKDGLKVLTKTGSTILVLAMNLRHQYLSNLETRRAVAQAIDKSKIIEVAYNGGEEVNVFWHRGNDFFTDQPSTFDPEYSRSYFAENPSGGILTISVPNAFPPHVRAAEIYQEMLGKVGLETSIEEVEWSVWLNRVYRGGEFDFTVIGHTGKLDPDFRLSSFGKGESYVGWKNDEFTHLVETARITIDTQKRAKLYQSALKIMTQHYPFVFIAENEVQFGVTKRVSDFEFDKVLERYDFRNTKI